MRGGEALGSNVSYLWMGFAYAGLHEVQRVEIGLGGGEHYIRIGAVAVDDSSGFFQAHGHFALGIGALGDGVDGVQLQAGAGAGQALDGLEGGVHRAGALGAGFLLLAVDAEHHAGFGDLPGARGDFKEGQAEVLGGFFAEGVGDQGLEVFVEDLVLLVGQGLEAGEGLVQLGLAGQVDAQLFQAGAEGVRPESLPRESLLVCQPTDWADMIS